MTNQETKEAKKLQATLTMIKTKTPCFFNVAQFMQMGLVQEHGKTPDNRTNWVLTEKAQQFLNVQI